MGDEQKYMSNEEGKIYGNTLTSILYPSYIGIKNTKLV